MSKGKILGIAIAVTFGVVNGTPDLLWQAPCIIHQELNVIPGITTFQPAFEQQKKERERKQQYVHSDERCMMLDKV